MPTQALPQTLSGEACLARRLELGLSRADLARLALVDQATLWRLEKGRGHVSRLTRERIERALAA